MSGVNRIYGSFETWFKKNSVIGEELSKTLPYARIYKTLDNALDAFSLEVYAYDGEGDTEWAIDELGNQLPNFRRVCTLAADLSGLLRLSPVRKGVQGQDFWEIAISINVRFGGTALKARMTWYERVSISHFYP